MTTKNSPLYLLKAQARRIAAMLKLAERGGAVPNDPNGKIAEARKRESIVVGIGMDDKVFNIEMKWAAIQKMKQADLAKFILDLMRETRGTVH